MDVAAAPTLLCKMRTRSSSIADSWTEVVVLQQNGKGLSIIGFEHLVFNIFMDTSLREYNRFSCTAGIGLGAWTIQRGSEGQTIGLSRVISEHYRATDLNLPCS